jgi:hypothetical protein
MTTTRRPEAGTDIWTNNGPWRFTREPVLTGAPAEVLYRLYRPAFEPLKVRSAARQVLTRTEFFDQMRDARVDKYVAWENAAEPIGVITITRHLESVPWISPDYFAARYPEHWARNAIYYLGFMLAHPGNRTARFLETIVHGLIEPLVSERAILAYDMCDHNSSVLGLSTRIADVLRRHAHTEPQPLDCQHYYGIAFG